jgi:hypothetical protein
MPPEIELREAMEKSEGQRFASEQMKKILTRYVAYHEYIRKSMTGTKMTGNKYSIQ